MWFSGLRETNWKPFGAFSLVFLFLKKNDGCGLSGAMGDRGQQMGAAALPLALNHVESKWASAIPARVLARKDPSMRNRYTLGGDPTPLCDRPRATPWGSA